EINEMDLNPVFIYENGLVCVDARIILKKPD
ncbi:MAG: acetate--CoA ligase family protein, partial [Promethearchaeota archaeon]